MRRSRTMPRPFTISDGMLLIAASAAGLAWSGSAWKQLGAPFQAMATEWAGVWERLTVLAALSLPLLTGWTLTIFVLIWRKPRPRWRRASRGPGMTAALAAMVGLATIAAIYLALLGREGMRTNWSPELWDELAGGLLQFFAMASPLVGFAVLVSWVIQAIQGRWRAEPTWIDRFGRLLGMLWMVAGAILSDIIVAQIYS